MTSTLVTPLDLKKLSNTELNHFLVQNLANKNELTAELTAVSLDVSGEMLVLGELGLNPERKRKNPSPDSLIESIQWLTQALQNWPKKGKIPEEIVNIRSTAVFLVANILNMGLESLIPRLEELALNRSKEFLQQSKPEESENDIVTLQKNVLGDMFKQLLPTVPGNPQEVDIRFLPLSYSSEDPLYIAINQVFLLKEPRNNGLFLSSISGGGKTAAAITLAQKKYCIFMQCEKFSSSIPGGEWQDETSKRFFKNFQRFGGSTNQAARENFVPAMIASLVDILSRILFLINYRKNWSNQSANNWLRLQLNGAKNYMASLTEDISMEIAVLRYDISIIEFLRKIILNYWEEAGKPIFIIDEANVWVSSLRNSLISESCYDKSRTPEDKDHRGLISYYLYALPQDSPFLIIGTKLPADALDEIRNSPFQKNTKHPRILTLRENVSALLQTRESGWNELNKYIDLSKIPDTLRSHIRSLLDGRLRKAFNLISDIFNELQFPRKIEKLNLNQDSTKLCNLCKLTSIVECYEDDLLSAATSNLSAQYESLPEGEREVFLETLSRISVMELLDSGKELVLPTPNGWNLIDFGIFMVKEKNFGIVEGIHLSAMRKWLKQKNHFPYQHWVRAIRRANIDQDETTRGVAFENLIGNLISDLSLKKPFIDWEIFDGHRDKFASPQWNWLHTFGRFGSTEKVKMHYETHIEAIKDAISLQKSALNDNRISNPSTIFEHPQFNFEKFQEQLNNSTYKYIPTHKELMTRILFTTTKAGSQIASDFLFLLEQPTQMLGHMSNLNRADWLGFVHPSPEDSHNDIIWFIVSVSWLNKHSGTKLISDEQASDPDYFYLENGTLESKPRKIYEDVVRIAKPRTKTLRLVISLQPNSLSDVIIKNNSEIIVKIGWKDISKLVPKEILALIEKQPEKVVLSRADSLCNSNRIIDTNPGRKRHMQQDYEQSKKYHSASSEETLSNAAAPSTEILRIDQAAAIMQVPESDILQLLVNKQLKGKLINNQWRIPHSAIDAYFNTD